MKIKQLPRPRLANYAFEVKGLDCIELFTWLGKRIGVWEKTNEEEGKWFYRCGSTGYRYTFYFQDEKEASLFKLRWL